MFLRIFVFSLASLGVVAWWFDLVPHWETRVAREVSLAAVHFNPSEFVGRRLRLKGEVIGAMTILGLAVFVLADAEGNTLDVVGYGATPEPGQKLDVTGSLKFISVPQVGALPLLVAERPVAVGCGVR